MPDVLPRLPAEQALIRVRLPLHLNWSQPGREFDLSDRRQRARVYQIVLREGTGQDIGQYVDGVLLADLWPELVLPAQALQADESLPVLIVTSDVPDLARLVSGRSGITVAHVGRLGGTS